jgi:orotate phosphoribosyltransferase
MEHLLRTSHLPIVFKIESRYAAIKVCCAQIRNIQKQGITVDALAFTGFSGVILGSMIADRLKLPILAVRRKEDKSHSNYDFEGVIEENGRYVLIDDFIDSGKTLRRIKQVISSCWPDVKCSAVILYSTSGPVDSRITNKVKKIFGSKTKVYGVLDKVYKLIGR